MEKKQREPKSIKTFECPVCGFVFKDDISEYESETDDISGIYNCKCSICLNTAHVFETESEVYQI